MINQKYDCQWAQAQNNPELVFFWKEREKWGEFSQFFQANFRAFPLFGSVGHQLFKHNEQWMMANKALLFGDVDAFNQIMSTRRPKECQDIGRTVKNFDQTVWDAEKYNIVLQGNLYKFKQNWKESDILLSTGNKILVEASPYDKVWGVYMDQYHPDVCNPLLWRGENLLGFVLMQVRDMLQE